MVTVALLVQPVHAGPRQQQYRDRFNAPGFAIYPGGITHFDRYDYWDVDGWGLLEFRIDPLSESAILVHIQQNGRNYYGSGTRFAPDPFGQREIDFFVLDSLD